MVEQKITLYRVTPGNYGDDLNSLIWPRMFDNWFGDTHYLNIHEFEEGDSKEILFVGIGTILNKRLPLKSKKIVFGAGAGYGQSPLVDDTMDIRFVRGPKTAKLLRLDPSSAITDPAILIREFVDEMGEIQSQRDVGFMPHHGGITNGWRILCDEHDILFIDPTEDVFTVTNNIRSVRWLITEAMHGAICADALRIPWTPLKATPQFNDFKWQDWLMTIKISPNFEKIPIIWDRDDDINSPSKILIEKTKMYVARRLLKSLLKSSPKYLSRDDRHRLLLSQIQDAICALNTARETAVF